MCICACVCVNLGQVASGMRCFSAFFSSVSVCKRGMTALVNTSFNTSVFNAFVFRPEVNVYFLGADLEADGRRDLIRLSSD